MDVLLLLKAVPTLEEIRVDPDRRAIDRTATPLLPNPFDARALAALLAQRRAGERLTVLSLGPPAARASLENALQLGADRAVLLSDATWSGADALGTASLLAQAAIRLPHDLAVTGRFSTDGSTASVPAMFATLRERPWTGPARAIARTDDGRLEVVVDTERGTATYRLPMRSVVIVGERIGKPGRVTPEMIAAASGRSVEVWSATDLGAVAPTTVASTEVLSFGNEAPRRERVILQDRPIAELVSDAVEFLKHRRPTARESPSERTGPRPVSEVGRMDAIVFVTDEEGDLHDAALPILSRLHGLGFRPGGAWVGLPSAGNLSRAARAGAVHSFVAPSPTAPVPAGAAAQQLDRILALSRGVQVCLGPTGGFASDVLAALAARRRLGLITDIEEVERAGDGLRWRKGSFARRAVATVRCRTRPELGTVRPAVWDVVEIAEPPPMGMSRLELAPDAVAVERVAAMTTVRPEWRGLEGRRVVVVVGRGIGGPENLDRIAPTLEAWDAGLAGTRKIVDAEWLPPELQVGLTGRTLAPELVLLIGVHGSPNHLTGLARARTLVAVNPDPAAPVFAHVDLGIVGRWEEVLPGLTRAVAPLLRASG